MRNFHEIETKDKLRVMLDLNAIVSIAARPDGTTGVFIAGSQSYIALTPFDEFKDMLIKSAAGKFPVYE